MNQYPYSVKLLLVYGATLAGGLLWFFVAGVLAPENAWAFIAVFLLPAVAAPIVFAVTLTRSPWLRELPVLRVLMVITGTIALSTLYLFMYAAYGQGVALYVRHAKNYLQKAF
jgi:hypothetical protein